MERTKLVAVRFPANLLNALDRYVGAGKRSKFIVKATERELMRLRQKQAGERAFGSWKKEDYPEFATSESVADWVSSSRRGSTRNLGDNNP